MPVVGSTAISGWYWLLPVDLVVGIGLVRPADAVRVGRVVVDLDRCAPGPAVVVGVRQEDVGVARGVREAVDGDVDIADERGIDPPLVRAVGAQRVVLGHDQAGADGDRRGRHRDPARNSIRGADTTGNRYRDQYVAHNWIRDRDVGIRLQPTAEAQRPVTRKFGVDGGLLGGIGVVGHELPGAVDVVCC